MLSRKAKASVEGNHEMWIYLLRIICMFWVILFHFAEHGTIDMTDVPLTVNWVFFAICRAGGGIANCIFVLITGYLLSEKRFKLSRIAVLWLEVWVYSVASYIISTALDQDTTMNIFGFAKSCVPILSNEYWFFSSYMLLYMLTPFLNLFQRKVNRTYHVLSVIVLLVCFSVPTIIPRVIWMTSNNNIGMFIALYLMGAFFKKLTLRERAKRNLLFFSVILILCLIGTEVTLKILKLNFFDFFVWPMYRPTVVVAACMLFLAMKGAKCHLPKLAVICAQSTFGIYLIHIGALQDVIFKQVFDIALHFGKVEFPFILIFYAVVIYILCVCIDRIRFYLLERNYHSMVDRASKWMESRIKTMLKILSDVIE